MPGPLTITVFVRDAGAAACAPLAVGAGATVAELAAAARDALGQATLPRLSFSGVALTDPCAAIADVGIASQAVVDAAPPGFRWLPPGEHGEDGDNGVDVTDGGSEASGVGVAIGSPSSGGAPLRFHARLAQVGSGFNIVGVVGVGEEEGGIYASATDSAICVYFRNGTKAQYAGDDLTTDPDYGASYTTGDVVTVEWRGGEVRFAINGRDQGVAYSGVPGPVRPWAQLSEGTRWVLVDDPAAEGGGDAPGAAGSGAAPPHCPLSTPH